MDEDEEMSRITRNKKRGERKEQRTGYQRRPRTRPMNKLRLKHKMILNPSLKDHIINITDSSQENLVESKKHKKVMKKYKIQEPKPIGKYPEEFQELDSEIIRKRMK